MHLLALSTAAHILVMKDGRRRRKHLKHSFLHDFVYGYRLVFSIQFHLFQLLSIGYPLEQNIVLMGFKWVIHLVGFRISSPSEGLSLKVLSKVHVTH